MFEPLAEHWNGSAWRIAATAAVTADDNELHAVTMISASDGWAVGESNVFISTEDGCPGGGQEPSSLTVTVSIGRGIEANAPRAPL